MTEARYRDGARRIAPIAVAAFAFGLSFGVLAGATGIGLLESVVMSTTIFAGSARRLDNGDTLLGWAADTASVTGEVSPDGTLLWNLADTATERSDRQFTYRAALSPIDDWAAPTVRVASPTGGAPLHHVAHTGTIKKV